MNVIAPLFVPADRPERFVKAAASGADAVIIDLEDAVAESRKDSARANLQNLALDMPVIVRVNAIGTAWHAADVEASIQAGANALMLPKCESVEPLAYLASRMPVIALVETAIGIEVARAIARSGHVCALAFGSVDYAADLGCAHVPAALASARAEIVLASRLGGLGAPIDGVTTNFADMQAVSNDAAAARALGFGGKLAIHPGQVHAIFKAFSPTDEELAWAKHVLSLGDGANATGGEMIDAPVRLRAQRILATQRES